jgi:hypothetical protein
MAEPMSETPPPATRRGSRLLFIALPVLVLGAGVAYWNFKSSTSAADSPQAAVERLVRAVTDEDPLGVLAALDPSEGDLLRDAYKPTADQAASQGVITDKGDPLASVDVSASNLKYSVKQLGEKVAAVTITDGNFSASFDPSKLPADTRKDLPPDFLRPRHASTSIAEMKRDTDGPEPPIVTVKRDSGWYVSVFYTIAEAVRTSSGVAQPDFDHPPATHGADSPKGVIEELAKAAGAVDLDRGLQLLDPESLRVLVDYRSAIEAQVNPKDLADARKNFAFALDTLDVTTTKLDDVHTRVDVSKLAAHTTLKTGRITQTATATVTGTCYTAVNSANGHPQPTAGCLKDTGYTFGLTSFFVVVAQRGGQYYLDPLRTIEEYARTMTTSKDFNSLMCQASGKQCKS